MVELALPQGYNSSPEVFFVDLLPQDGSEDPHYDVPTGFTARPRLLEIELTTGVGGQANVNAFFTLPNSLGVTVGSFQQQPASTLWSHQWSTEVGAAYVGASASDDAVSVNPLPVVPVPAKHRIKIEVQSVNFSILGAIAMIELYPGENAGIGGQSSEDRVYLLQAARPGQAGGFA